MLIGNQMVYLRNKEIISLVFCENSYAYLFPDFTLHNLITASKLLKITAHCTSRDTCRLDPLCTHTEIIIIHLYNSHNTPCCPPLPPPPQKKGSGIIFTDCAATNHGKDQDT